MLPRQRYSARAGEEANVNLLLDRIEECFDREGECDRERLATIVRQVAREERERCAKVCDKMLEQEGNNSEVHKRRCHAVDAAAIRSLRDVP